jgi:hypothetical protein
MPAHATRARALAATLATGVALASCSAGPASKAEVCTSFAKLDTQLAQGNAGFGNPLFRAITDLGDIADRYPGGSLASDAAALHAIGDQTDSNELRNDTMHIQALCGRPPVGLGGLLDGS